MSTLRNIIIGISLFFLALIVLFILNYKSAECLEGHLYNEEEGVCYYKSTECLDGEYSDGENCIYTKEGFMSSKVIIILLVIIFCFLLIFLIFKNYNSGYSYKEIQEFDESKKISTKTAKQLIIKHIVTESDECYYVENKDLFKYDKSFLRVSILQQPFKKGNYEWFCHFEVEILKGRDHGIYNCICSLSRGEEWLSNNIILNKGSFGDYIEKPIQKPLFQRVDKAERHAEMLIQQGKISEASKLKYSSVDHSSDTNSSPEIAHELNKSMNTPIQRPKTKYKRRSYYGR